MWLLAAALISIFAFAQEPREGASGEIAIVGYLHDACPIPLDGTVSLTVPATGKLEASQPVGSEGRVAFASVPRRTYQLRVAVHFAAEIDRTITPGTGNKLDLGTIEIQRNMSCDIVTVTALNPLPALAPQSQTEPIDTTVCDVVNDPERFFRRSVRLKADAGGFVIDHSAGLSDGNCPHARLDLKLPPDSTDYNLRRLGEALAPLRIGCSTYLGRSATAIFIGRPEYAFSLDSKIEVLLKVEAVEDVIPHSLPSPIRTCRFRGRLHRLKRLFS